MMKCRIFFLWSFAFTTACKPSSSILKDKNDKEVVNQSVCSSFKKDADVQGFMTSETQNLIEFYKNPRNYLTFQTTHPLPKISFKNLESEGNQNDLSLYKQLFLTNPQKNGTKNWSFSESKLYKDISAIAKLDDPSKPATLYSTYYPEYPESSETKSIRDCYFSAAPSSLLNQLIQVERSWLFQSLVNNEAVIQNRIKQGLPIDQLTADQELRYRVLGIRGLFFTSAE